MKHVEYVLHQKEGCFYQKREGIPGEAKATNIQFLGNWINGLSCWGEVFEIPGEKKNCVEWSWFLLSLS